MFKRPISHGMGQFGDAVSVVDVKVIDQLIRHETFDGSAF